MAACDTGAPKSVLEINNFWRKTLYNIGGYIFSLDDIEHGVLRGTNFFYFFYACHEGTMIIMVMIAIIVLNSSLGFFPISPAFWKMFNKQNNNINNISYYYR